MDSTTTISKSRRWTARILSGIGILFFLFDSTIHLAVPTPVVDAFRQLGYPIGLSVTLGIIELVCLILYVVPQTSILGAILLTGYLGGAISAQLRIGAPLFSTALFPVYLAVFLWGGLYLVDNRVRSLIPVRRNNE